MTCRKKKRAASALSTEFGQDGITAGYLQASTSKFNARRLSTTHVWLLARKDRGFSPKPIDVSVISFHSRGISGRPQIRVVHESAEESGVKSSNDRNVVFEAEPMSVKSGGQTRRQYGER